MAIDVDGSIVNDVDFKCEGFLVCPRQKLESITVQELLSSPLIINNLIQIRDYSLKSSYGENCSLSTILFSLDLGSFDYKIRTFAEISKFNYEGEILQYWLNEYKSEKINAILRPLDNKNYMLKQLDVGFRRFNFL